MKKWKKKVVLCLCMVLTASAITACGGVEERNDVISLVSREEGSGTRGAFVELLGIEEKNEDGEKVDRTVDTAEITNSTSVMVQTIVGNETGIGYISLGSLDDSVKALKIDGATATLKNVKSGAYKVVRPFNIVMKENISESTEDFIRFVMSQDGQAIVEDMSFVSKENTGTFQPADVSGKVTVSGSSSVTPVMQKLAEEYQKINPKVEVSVQQSDSTTGIMDTVNGISDIGMASRALSDEETRNGIISKVIALDGIAIIVNHDCPIDEMTAETVRKIYTGEITLWSQMK